MDTLAKQPGLGLRELARATGYAPTSIRHAVLRLEAAGALQRRPEAGRQAHRLTGRPPAATLPPPLRDLLDWLRAHPGATPPQAVSAFPDKHFLTIRHRLKQLVRRGLANESRTGRFLQYAAN